MPMLGALDLLESRGLPRQVALLSEIEAEKLDDVDQLELCLITRSKSTDAISALEQGDNNPETLLPTQLRRQPAMHTTLGLLESRSRHHSRSWPSNGSNPRRKSRNTRAWANDQIGRVSPYQADARLPTQLHQQPSATVQKLVPGQRGLRTCTEKEDYNRQAADLGKELKAWAWSEGHHSAPADIALVLCSLAAVNSKDKVLINALTLRANLLAGSFSSLQMAMIWQALADLGETPAPAAIDEMVQQVMKIAATFKVRHAKQTVASMQKCGVYDSRAFAALKRLSERVDDWNNNTPRNTGIATDSTCSLCCCSVVIAPAPESHFHDFFGAGTPSEGVEGQPYGFEVWSAYCGPALLEARCPYNTDDDTRLHEVLQLLKCM